MTIFDYFLNNVNKIIYYNNYDKILRCYFVNDTVVIDYKTETINIIINEFYYFINEEFKESFKDLKDLIFNSDINGNIKNFILFMFKK